jgi:GT2 family glycosyltransferase
LATLTYPKFEVIVVSDGSTDQTASIAKEYSGVRLIETPNGGLSSARNVGMRAATGEIVAYIDDDAYPDPHWLHYLANAFCTSNHSAVGGPNLPPADDGPIAECVAKAPGGPIQVLVHDDLADHIPGCNFVVRKSALEAIGGWDPIYRNAGDDVDLCWRLQQHGLTIGFHPAAVVWHHRRNSIKTYWKQQRGYGKAEALLENKWPERYNAAGHVNWAGRLYGAGVLRGIGLTSRIYHGMWNSAPFQLLYQADVPMWQALAQMPEWYLANALLGGLCLLGLSWPPLLWLSPLFAFGVLLPILQIARSVAHTEFSRPSLRWLTAALFMIQPAARLWGRLAHGLTPWRRRGPKVSSSLWSREQVNWSETWRDTSDWLESVRTNFCSMGAVTVHGGDYDRWDFQIRGGLVGSARLRLAVEEHGSGKQLLRWKLWPRISPWFLVLVAALAFSSLAALTDAANVAAGVLAALVLATLVRAAIECRLAMGLARSAVENLK